MALGQYNGGKGLYHLDGNANDSSGNGNNGTATNVTWVGGKIGSGAVMGNGTSSKIDFTSPTVTTFTIVITFQLNALGIFQSLFKLGNAADNQNALIRVNTNNTISGITYNGSTERSGTTIETFKTGIKYNLIVTNSGTSSSIYLNGKFLKSFIPHNIIYGGDNSSLLYQRLNNVYYVNGIVDEAILENYTWTTSQIRKYYTFSKGIFGIL